MKKLFLFSLVLFVAGISAVTGQTHQTLTQGQIFTTTLEVGEVHTYRIRLGNDAEYFIAWDDWDTSDDYGVADVRVGVRGDGWGQYVIEVQDWGNFGENAHRLINPNHQSSKINPLNIPRNEWNERGGSATFVPNAEYIIEVRGLGGSSRGTYRIVFY